MKVLQHLRSDWFRYGFEILAFIAGILVAFALDNWNEERKLKNEELKLLADIRSNLETTIEHLIEYTEMQT